ncbi:MAG: hypothetical protein II604_01605 [Bacteroidales bacterium]|nr:hypothetical protein [Bacteroidales bacterium]
MSEKREYYDCSDGEYLRLNIDLLSMVFAEDITHECTDGIERRGVFVPYEENGMYLDKNGRAYANFNAFKSTPEYRMKFRSPSIYIILPYWSIKLAEKLKELGYTRQDRFQGFISRVRRKGSK